MKFIHLADVHLADNFKFQSSYSKKIRDLTWKSFTNILMDNKDSDFALISGDLYEKSHFTSKDFDNLFKIIEEFSKEVFYVAGNHDYLDSYTRLFISKSPKNFHYFDSKSLSVKEIGDIRIYGLSYEDRILDFDLDLDIPLDKGFFNILLAHGDLNDQKSTYLNINKEDIINNDFDYIAYGHIHKREKFKNLIYPGSIEPFDFKHLENHGYVLYEDGAIKFVDSSLMKFYDLTIDFNDFNDHDLLIDNINSRLHKKTNFLKLNLSNVNMIDEKYLRENIDAFYIDIKNHKEKSLESIIDLYPNSLLSKFDEKFNEDTKNSLAYKYGIDAILRSKND